MAKYADVIDCVDPLLTVSALNLADADVYVDLALANIGITETEAALITLPNPALKAIASAWALRQASVQGMMADSSVLSDKARIYKETADMLVKKLTRTGLGLPTATTPTGGYGVINLGRA